LRKVLIASRGMAQQFGYFSLEVLSGPKVASIWGGLLGKEVHHAEEDLDAFEEQMQQQSLSWSAFDLRIMFQGYLERGFVAEEGDLEILRL
jgi:hypothetical protein